jgi:hypothetical protein
MRYYKEHREPMKPTLILATAVMLAMLSATTAFASHGAKLLPAPLPAHGSIWYGQGLEQYAGAQTAMMPLPMVASGLVKG